MTSKFNQLISKNFKLIIFIFFYSTILIGFYLDENSTLGPKIDFLGHLQTLYAFDSNLKYALLNYDTNEYPTRISPIFLLYLFYLKKLFVNIDLMRFVSLNIYLISPFVFYNALKIKFKYIDKNLLFFFSSFLYLSPSFRANAIWPESSMLGLLFFLFSVYFFLKFEKNKKFLFAILNIIFLSIAAYIRPSYSLFALFFFIVFYKEYLISYKTFILFVLNILLSLLAIYYLFILDIFFISTGGLSYNISNKILVISSIIFFYLFPFLIIIFRSNKIEISFKKLFIFFIFYLIAYYYLILNFNYDLNIAGGGFFLHLSNYLYNSNNIFFIVSFFAILSIIYLLNIDKEKNFLLILILFLFIPQTHIFHKYYDPIFIICLTLLFQVSIEKIFEKKLLFGLSLYFFSFYLINLFNSLFIKF